MSNVRREIVETVEDVGGICRGEFKDYQYLSILGYEQTDKV